MALSLLVAATARADTYCVVPNSTCDGPHTKSTIQAALNQVAADGGAGGTINLGGATYSENALQYSGSVPLTLNGVNQSATTITNAGSGPAVFDGAGSGALTVQSLAVTIPASSGQVGIESFDPLTVQNVTITGSGTPNGLTGISMDSGTVMNTTITLPTPAGGTDTAIFAVPPTATTATVQDSTLTAINGVDDAGTGTVVGHRLRVSAISTSDNAGAAFSVNQSNQLSVDDSLVTVNHGGYGLNASTATSGTPGVLSARQLTIVSDGTGTGVRALSSANTASISLSDSIIRNVATSADREASGSGTANVSIDHSDYPADSGHIIDTGAGSYTHTSNIDTDPLFFSSTDFHLLPGSPALNQDTAAQAAGESATDMDGHPRFVTATQRDMGAYQHQPPTAGASAAPASQPTGVAFTFSGSGSDPDPGDSLAYSWSFDDGGAASGATVSHAFSTTGTHSGTLTVTDATGLTSTATATVTVTSPPSSAAGPAGGGGQNPSGPGPIALASIDTLHLTNSVFAVGPQPTAVSARRVLGTSGRGGGRGVKRGAAKRGTTFMYTLSAPATVTITIQGATAGTFRAGQCSVARTRRARRARHCTYYAPVGTLTREGVEGPSSTPFSGRVGTRPLKPGHYRASLVARNAGGDSPARTVDFTIVRG
ncbi:MAG TPA: PKD domain-containing protein [Solirubrobacteraceae bacterium]|nr:PKD domain-containing protein [Solirubrobacteraceae bacterium]